MNGNSFGTIFRVSTWGESHGPALGALIDGCPSGLPIGPEDFVSDMNLRQGGKANFATSRQESDQVEIESGIFAGKTTGTPILLRIRNENSQSSDYAPFADVPRPGHADLTTQLKHGHRDPRGGGRSSARETAARVAAGVVAKKLLYGFGIEIFAYLARLGELALPSDHSTKAATASLEAFRPLRNGNPLHLPLTVEASGPWLKLAEMTKAEEDSLGGAIFCVTRGLSPGLGEPIFDKLNALLAHALMSLPAAVACEIGGGRAMSFAKGSEIRDPIVVENGRPVPAGLHHGGLLGGMTSGAPLFCSVDFHGPTSVPKPIASISLSNLQPQNVEVRGRHDAVPLPRAVPVVEAMVAITLADAMMRAGRIPEKL